MMVDTETGISIRFVRSWRPETDRVPTVHDQALMLAMIDERDVPLARKIEDAYLFLLSRYLPKTAVRVES